MEPGNGEKTGIDDEGDRNLTFDIVEEKGRTQKEWNVLVHSP